MHGAPPPSLPPHLPFDLVKSRGLRKLEVVVGRDEFMQRKGLPQPGIEEIPSFTSICGRNNIDLTRSLCGKVASPGRAHPVREREREGKGKGGEEQSFPCSTKSTNLCPTLLFFLLLPG